MSSERHDKESPTNDGRQGRELLSRVTGSTTGALVGMLIGGAEGAVLGSSAGPVFASLTSDVLDRALGRREQKRVLEVVRLASARLEELLAAGETLRTDGFFDDDPTDRSRAEEILEAVLLVAQREHEQRKLPYVANVFANLAVTEGLSQAQANLLVRISSELSYTQIRLLVIFARRDQLNLRAREYLGEGAADQTFFLPIDHSILHEAADLWRRGLIANLSQGPQGRTPHMFSIVPAKMTPVADGVLLHRLMDLNQMSTDEFAALLEDLRWNGDPRPENFMVGS